MNQQQTPTRDDDLFAKGILAWSQRVREGQLTFEETIAHSLARHAALPHLDAFECLSAEPALATAKAHDALLAAGTDLGPLMGAPMGVKDIMAADGLPTTNGSNADTAHITGAQGSVVTRLKQAGAIVLGKTRTVEFALGATGINEARGTPWNAADNEVHRIPGGSSSGSAVATTAGIIAFGLGSDTGGSIRIPACFHGIVGHKTSVGRWPTDGVFPLSQTLDSLGALCRTVSDAALLNEVFTGEALAPPAPLSGLRIGVPQSLFMDDLDEVVADDFNRALEALKAAGAIVIEFDFPEANERTELFTRIVPAELLSKLGIETFQSIRSGMDSVTAARAAVGLDVTAVEYVRAQQRRKDLTQRANETFNEFDCWMTPNCPFVAMPVANLADPAMQERSLLASRNTQPGNLFDFCGISLPMQQHNNLPTGLQILMPHGKDSDLLALSLSVTDAIQ